MAITSPEHSLFSVLKGHILHCTSVKAFISICKEGSIRPNKDLFPCTWDQTKGSCVHQLGGISLLDFGVPEDKVFFVKDEDDFFYPWNDILVAHNPLTVIIKFNRKRILNKIIPWEVIYNKTKARKCLLIPYTEVCTLEPISVNLIESIVVVRSFSKFNEITDSCCGAGVLNNLRKV